MVQKYKPHAISRFFNLLKSAGLDAFLLLLLCMIALAYLYPPLGANDSAIPLKDIASYGISVIFLFYGLRLSPEK